MAKKKFAVAIKKNAWDFDKLVSLHRGYWSNTRYPIYKGMKQAFADHTKQPLSTFDVIKLDLREENPSSDLSLLITGEVLHLKSVIDFKPYDEILNVWERFEDEVEEARFKSNDSLYDYQEGYVSRDEYQKWQDTYKLINNYVTKRFKKALRAEVIK